MTNWSPPSARTRFEILRATRTVAVVGASPDPSRPSHFVATYLVSSSVSFDAVWFIHPTADELLGRPVYRSLADLPEPPDLVDVFRRREHLLSVLRDTIEVGAKTLWLQQGLWDDEVARDGAAAGLRVVMDRCLKVDHARLLG